MQSQAVLEDLALVPHSISPKAEGTKFFREAQLSRTSLKKEEKGKSSSPEPEEIKIMKKRS